MDSIALALLAMLAGLLLASVYVLGYYSGRKDRTPGGRR